MKKNQIFLDNCLIEVMEKYQLPAIAACFAAAGNQPL